MEHLIDSFRFNSVIGVIICRQRIYMDMILLGVTLKWKRNVNIELWYMAQNTVG